MDVMMKKSAVFLTLLAAACSNGGPTPEQQRITQLEGENAQLQAQLKESRDNVTKLHAAIGRSGSTDEGSTEEPAGAVAPQPVNPQPATNLGGGSSNGSSGGYVE
jgi:hypothetical protein